jgi:hypothetical protein
MRRRKSLLNKSWEAVGLLVGIVGLLLAVKPRLEASPQYPMLRNSQPFTVPFRLSNTGFLPMHIDGVACYLSRVEGTSYVLGDLVVYEAGWGDRELPGGESETVQCRIGISEYPQRADIAVVVLYHNWGMPSLEMHYFRFVGSGPGDNWQWLQQPSAEIEAASQARISQWKRRVEALQQARTDGQLYHRAVR